MDIIQRASELAEAAGGGWLPAEEANVLAKESAIEVDQLGTRHVRS